MNATTAVETALTALREEIRDREFALADKERELARIKTALLAALARLDKGMEEAPARAVAIATNPALAGDVEAGIRTGLLKGLAMDVRGLVTIPGYTTTPRSVVTA